MVNIPIWLLVILSIGCLPALIIIVSFILFMISNAIRDLIDEKERK